MRSQVMTIMAPEDEAAFLGFVFERPTVFLIPDVRNPTPDVPHIRDVRRTASLHCMLWDTAILPRLRTEYILSCNDYYLRSEEALIQFLRSPTSQHSIGTGRIAVATGLKGEPDTNPETARAITAWYGALRRWIQSNFSNSFVYASDYKPDVGYRERMVWVGPRAIELSSQQVKLKHNGPPDWSLHYFDPADEKRALMRYRKPKTVIGVGRVACVGDVVSETTRRQVFRIKIERGAPFSEFEGAFMWSRPVPKVGDEVACVFNENISGTHSEPWEPGEIKKLTPANRARVLSILTKALRR